MKPPMKPGSPDDFQTPPHAIHPLIPFLNKDWTIWECACGKGYLVDEFRKLGFKVIGTDIKTGLNFLKTSPKNPYDCIITNPPYSLKHEFLKRCYQIGKPFALLFPLTNLETAKRQALFKKYGLELILFDKRINFETPTGEGGGAWFASAWFTNWLNLPKELNFVKLINPRQQRLEVKD